MPNKSELDSTFLLWNPGNMPLIRSHESKLSAFGSAHLVEDSYESLRFKVSTSRWKRFLHVHDADGFFVPDLGRHWGR